MVTEREPVVRNHEKSAVQYITSQSEHIIMFRLLSQVQKLNAMGETRLNWYQPVLFSHAAKHGTVVIVDQPADPAYNARHVGMRCKAALIHLSEMDEWVLHLNASSALI